MHNCTIENNNIVDNNGGISLESGNGGSSYNAISGNNITNNINYGIMLYMSSNNIVSGNNIAKNGYGVSLIDSTDNVLRENIMVLNEYSFQVAVWPYDPSSVSLSDFANDIDTSNTVNGKPVYYWINKRDMVVPHDAGYVALVNCTRITVQDLNLTNNGQGILLAYTTDSTITNNNMVNNHFGVEMLKSPNSVIYGNSLTKNDFGVHIFMCSGSIISGNNLTANKVGINLDYASNGNFVFHNNFVNNENQVNLMYPGESSVWDDGYPSGGNYWSDFAGLDEYSGPNQDMLGSDGIGDTPYAIDENNQDNYPLMKTLTVTPNALFTFTPSDPVINQTVSFNALTSYDLDGTIISFRWDFGDGANATGVTADHVYKDSGVYYVTLTVTDNDGLIDSIVQYVKVGKLSSGVSISTYPKTITIGENTTINGSITPTCERVTVAIWYRVSGDITWNNLTTIATDENSTYSYVWTPSEAGTYELKASWLGDNHTLPAESSITIFVCIKITAFVSLSTNSSSTFIGFRVNVTGVLRDTYGDVLEHETIVLYYTFGGITTWTPITSDTTDNLGRYSIMWFPPSIGYFEVKAEWARNSTHSKANNATTLNSLAYHDQYVFSVESNSTILELTFNTTDWTLSFTATGQNGTRGYSKVTVAKSLVTDIANIRVYLDGSQTQHSIAAIGDSWLLTFTYMHSTHQVDVDLDIDIIPEFSLFLILPLFMIATLLIVITYRRKHAM